MSSTPEKNLYQQLKKNVNKIQWLRIESWATQGVPDLLGTTENGVLFTIELKVTKSKQIKISPHQIAFHKTRKNSPCFILVKSLVQRPSKKSQLYLYPSFQLEQLLTKGLEPSFLVPDGWLNFEQHLLNLISPVNP
jgi:Holliday junction resolvase